MAQAGLIYRSFPCPPIPNQVPANPTGSHSVPNICHPYAVPNLILPEDPTHILLHAPVPHSPDAT